MADVQIIGLVAASMVISFIKSWMANRKHEEVAQQVHDLHEYSRRDEATQKESLIISQR